MRKSRAIFLLIVTAAVIGGYVAWAAWNPAPTLQSLAFHENVDADARSAAQADFRAHPPEAQEMTWHRFLRRLADPYQPRGRTSVSVGVVRLSDGAKFMSIEYPREIACLATHPRDGRWSREAYLIYQQEHPLSCRD